MAGWNWRGGAVGFFLLQLLATSSGCGSGSGGGDGPVLVGPELTRVECAGQWADVVYPLPDAEVRYTTLAVVHWADGRKEYQLPAFEPVEGGTRATVGCYDGADHAVFERAQ